MWEKNLFKGKRKNSRRRRYGLLRLRQDETVAQGATTIYRQCDVMTTYLRFSCNDLLRFGQQTLKPDVIKHELSYYMIHLVYWPGICHVASGPGGHIMGYVLGFLDEWDGKETGRFSVFSWDRIDVGKNLANLFEDGCLKMFQAHKMKIIVNVNSAGSFKIFRELGYEGYKMISGFRRMRKLLPGGLVTEVHRRPSILEEYEPKEADSSSSSQIDCIANHLKKKLRRQRILGMGNSTISF